MKRALFALLIGAIVVVGAWSQPKVAVLDAMIPKSMDPSIIVPATEKIIERLVNSQRFTVLDRDNIESVLKEREFQVSGMVSDQDIVTAGKYLGADFVVVAKVSQVADTYFISAKMIAIKTGVIAKQTSAQGEGKLSALIDLAEQVGETLSGASVLVQSATGPREDTKPEPAPAVAKVEPAPQQPAPAPDSVPLPPPSSQKKPKDKLKTTLLFSYGGASGTQSDDNTSYGGSGAGGDIFALVPIIGGLSIVGNADFMSFVDSSDSSVSWTQNDFLAGVGLALNLGAFVPYADVKGGATTSAFTAGSTNSGSGGAFGFDLGFNLDLGRWFVLGLRYQYVAASLKFSAFTYTQDYASDNFFVSAGIRF